MAIMQPAPQQVRITPATHHITLGVELYYRWCQNGSIQIIGYHILSIENVNMITTVQTHPTQSAGEPIISQWQLRPQGIDLELWNLLRPDRHRNN